MSPIHVPAPPPNPRTWAWRWRVATEIAKAIVWPWSFDYEPLKGFEPVRVPTHDEKLRAAVRAEVRR